MEQFTETHFVQGLGSPHWSIRAKRSVGRLGTDWTIQICQQDQWGGQAVVYTINGVDEAILIRDAMARVIEMMLAPDNGR